MSGQQDRSNPLAALFKEADEQYHRGETSRAIASLMHGLAERPDAVDIYYHMTGLLLDARCFPEALDAINAVPAPYKDRSETLVFLAYCLAGAERYEEAQRTIESALRESAGTASALNLRGVLAHRRGDAGAAESFYRQAIAADQSFGRAWTNLGLLRREAGQHAEGLDLLERGFSLAPLAAECVAAYHTAVTTAGAFAQGEQKFREALAANPASRRIAFLLIDLLLQQEKFGAAMVQVEQAMAHFGIDDGILSAALDLRGKIGPGRVRTKPPGASTLSLCMIVKNEVEHLARCLASVRPVADELIVVDTGSTDRTKDIAAAFGATVHSFPWTNDFSEARNYSLSKAGGDWVLVLDADETISPRDHAGIIRLMRTGRPAAYTFETRNYIPQIHKTGWIANDGVYGEEAGAGWFGSTKVRLFPRDGRIRFVNAVHELVEPSLEAAGIPILPCSIPVHHYGKLDQEKVAAKWKEYYVLGRKKLDASGENVQALKELAVQAAELKYYDEAIDLWQRVIVLQPRMESAYLNLASVYLQKDEFGPALAAASKARELNPDSREVVCNYALCALYAGDAEEAEAMLGRLLAKDRAYTPAAIMLAVARLCTGDGAGGRELFANLGITGPPLAECILPFADKMLQAGRRNVAAALLDAAREENPGNAELARIRAVLCGGPACGTAAGAQRS